MVCSSRSEINILNEEDIQETPSIFMDVKWSLRILLLCWVDTPSQPAGVSIPGGHMTQPSGASLASPLTTTALHSPPPPRAALAALVNDELDSWTWPGSSLIGLLVRLCSRTYKAGFISSLLYLSYQWVNERSFRCKFSQTVFFLGYITAFV